MKKRMLTLSVVAILALATWVIFSCSKDNSEMIIAKSSVDYALSAEELEIAENVEAEIPDCNFVTISSVELTEVEIEMLKFVREEEKMARDVYDVLSGKFNKPIFRNIAKSEQVHMDRVLCLLLHFNVEDPASDQPGIFSNEKIQDLYDDLIELGMGSITDALTAGATIEDFDIEDINYWMQQTDNAAIINVFQGLVCGSGNHLVSFAELLGGFEIDYVPVYISADEYNAILTAGHQVCGF